KNYEKNVRIKIISLVNTIVKRMNESTKIELHRLHFDDEFYDEISLLLSKGILKEENKKISFFHQTFYEYVYARNFVINEMSLYNHILNSNQDLEIRDQIKQIIQFIRGTNGDTYLTEVKNIIMSNDIRFHVKILLISYFGSIEKPTNKEYFFIKEIFENESIYEQYFIESWISPDWIKFFYNDNFFNSDNIDKYNLFYKLETFINVDTDLILDIITKYPYDENIKKRWLIRCFNNLDKWKDENLTLLKKYDLLKFNDDTWYFDLNKLYNKIYSIDTDYSIKIFFSYLNNKICQINHYYDDLLDHKWIEILEFLLNKNDVQVFHNLLDSICKISERFKNNSDNDFLITDKVLDDDMWSSQELGYSTWVLYRSTLEKMEEIALNDNERFMNIIKPFLDKRYLSIINFQIFGYSKKPQKYMNEIYNLLTNLNILEEIYLFNKNGYKFAMLLKNSYEFFDEIKQKTILDSIVRVNQKSNQKFYTKGFGNNYDLHRYKLLSLINENYIDKFNYLKQYQELKRKYFKIEIYEPEIFLIRSTPPPLLVSVYEKMNTNHWLKSFHLFNGLNKRKNFNYSRGSITEHHRMFETEVTKNPSKFYDLLKIMANQDILPIYLSSGLNGLVTSNFDNDKITKIVKLYSNIDDILLKTTILKTIGYLASNNNFVPFFINFLEANKNITHEGVLRDSNRFQSINDHLTSSINSFEGRFAEILPLVFINIHNDKYLRERVMILIFEVIDRNIDFVLFGLLRTLSNITKVDKVIFSQILIKILDQDKTGQMSIFCLKYVHYLFKNNFITIGYLNALYRKCVNYSKMVKDSEDSIFIADLGMYLYYYYINENKEIFRDQLNEVVSSNNYSVDGVFRQIFNQEFHSESQEKVDICKNFILKIKNQTNFSYSYEFDLKKLNRLDFIKRDFEFIIKLASTLHIDRDIKNFIVYLNIEYRSDTSLLRKILEILMVIISNLDTRKNEIFYDSESLVKFIFELYSRVESENDKKNILDLIDKFLMNDTLRHKAKLTLD
ncbi:MAG: hypothetical protein JXR48_10390, partial [Candidatus Delongbacteria bacterium]|nr:hypothetical protein [Candidatus Delongbacteria bacterium]